MADYRKYEIAGETLDSMADAVRRKYGFTDKLNPKNFPLYMSSDSNEFWLTHFGTSPVGSGSIYTSDNSFTMEPGEFTAKFKKNPNVPNGYNLIDMWDSHKLEYTSGRFLETDLTLLSQGCSYTTSLPNYDLSDAHGGALTLHDDKTRLTDGVDPLSCIDPLCSRYSAWQGAFDTPVEVILDLSSKRKIGQVKIFGIYNFWGVPMPTDVKIGYSSTGRDNEPFDMMDIPYTCKVVKDGNSYINSSGDIIPSKIYEIAFDLDTLMETRYLKLQFWGRFTWLNEIQVYGITNSKSYHGYRQYSTLFDDIENIGKFKDGDIAVFGSYYASELSLKLENMSIDNPEEFKKYTCWLARKISSSSKYYNVVGRFSFGTSYQTGDMIVLYKGSVEGVNIDPIITASEKFFYIDTCADGSAVVEFLSRYKPTFTHSISVGNDEFIYKVVPGSPKGDLLVSRSSTWNRDDLFIFENLDLADKTIPTNTPAINYLSNDYNSLATYDIITKASIILDGNLLDSGWRDGGWYHVSSHNGYYSKVGGIDSLDYKYKIKTDDEYLYFAITAEDSPPKSSSVELSLVRLWLRTDLNSTLYTHVYGVGLNGRALTKVAKRNTSLTSNSAEEIADSSLTYKYSGWESQELEINSGEELGKFVIEFRISLAELGNPDEFEYIVSHGNARNDNATLLYAQHITKEPYVKWDSEAAAHLVTENAKLSSDEALALIEEILL